MLTICYLAQGITNIHFDKMISLGIEQLILNHPDIVKGKRLGLLCNQASTDADLLPSHELLNRSYPGQLTCLFSPQHGFMAEKQDNMIESDHSSDGEGRPLFSLYGETRRPNAEMFKNLDLLLVDLFDVGTRVYTFMSTMFYCLEEAACQQKSVVVLDRPNPIGGTGVEGNILQDGCSSFVGLYPLPMRHGMTMGELALYCNDKLSTPADLTIVKMGGWQRQMLYPDTGLPWVYPSPNMPTFHTAAVYPGQVIWEGTNISEGRGTSLPFELCGAPFLDVDKVLQFLEPTPLPGCLLRPVGFEPTSNKWQGMCCRGFQVHVTDLKEFLPYRTSLAILQAIVALYPDQFAFKDPPYEYEYERLPLDLIIGDVQLRKALLAGENLVELENSWQEELAAFVEARRKYLLY